MYDCFFLVKVSAVNKTFRVTKHRLIFLYNVKSNIYCAVASVVYSSVFKY